jgi:NAD-dependent SIR2 family protein deacetylase
MADTAHKTEKEVVEHTESPEVVESKLDTLAAMMTAARNPIAWTGAGVSTSAGIPDFRGPNGKWTRAAQGKKPTATALKATTTLSATPTATHRSIVELLRTERLKFLISTNTDGLHRRSGVPGTKIAELHGNSNRVRCADCGAVAFLDDRTRTARKAHDHDTPWKCFRGAACKPTMKKPPLTQQQREAAAAAAARPKQQSPAVMMDTIINFCEYLEDHVQSTANAKSEKADLLLVLGTSLRVITCDALESIVANRGKLIIVNKQITPYDDDCVLRIFADCDAVMPG